MNNKLPDINLEKFAHSYDSFFDASIHILKTAETMDTLIHILPVKICKQYRFSEYSRNHIGLMNFLNNTYISQDDKDGFVSFLNLILPKVIGYSKKLPHQQNAVHKHLTKTLMSFIDLIRSTNEPEVFDLDFYYDKKDVLFKRKLDSATIETINHNASELNDDDTNRLRYEECVAEFLSFKQDSQSNKNLFYNQSLDKLKRIVENTLENGYKKDDGSFPKLSNKTQISNILFDSLHPEFENRIGYVVENIHHEQGGKPKKFTEKEYVYLWLELNQILYMLNRYKK